ncbi:MAG: penicillin-insensitive murein endopeptidase [Hyphomicrobiales bacterium]|nr:penicillin-insensitive murein endopeptidase [Hyphomicrobiales bacterium]
MTVSSPPVRPGISLAMFYTRLFKCAGAPLSHFRLVLGIMMKTGIRSGCSGRTERNAMRLVTILALILSADLMVAANASELPAKQLFSEVGSPAPLPPRPVGAYSNGCVAGAVALPADGPEWQHMRLSRNRSWGTPQLVAFVEKLARDAKTKDSWPGLLVGDLGQPRGGPTPTDHSSHENGLDVDIWFAPMPDRRLSVEERETMPLQSVLVPGSHFKLDMNKVPEGLDRLLKRTASYPEVQRILVNPGIKKLLCDRSRGDRGWLRKIRPWYKHDDHFHVRLRCPSGSSGCRAQKPPPRGNGCGVGLAYWFTPAPWKPPSKPAAKPAETMLSDMPPACADILAAGGAEGADVGDVARRDLPPLPKIRPRN